MASQITHVVLADRLYPKYFSHFSRRELFVGTTFPDIRKLAQFSRDKTHLPVSSLAELQDEPNAFIAGVKLHNYVDQVRQKFIDTSGLYTMYRVRQNPLTVAKLFEDTMLYDKLSDWHQVCRYYDHVLQLETDYPATLQQIKEWHSGLQAYMRQPPTIESRMQYLALNAINPAWMIEINQAIARLQYQSEAVAIAQQLYDNFEDLSL